MIDKAKWEWYGSACHLIVGDDCRFHLGTLIGKWIVSTVGEWLPGEGVREIMAKSRGIKLEGMGDERLASWMRHPRGGFEEIGAGRKYETMVFLAGDACKESGCPMRHPVNGECLDASAYNDAKAATEGHMLICEQWAAK